MTISEYIKEERKKLGEITQGEWKLYSLNLDSDYPTTIASSQIAAYNEDIKTHVLMCRLGSPDKICMEKADINFILNAPQTIDKLLRIIEVQQEALQDISYNSESYGKGGANCETRIIVMGVDADAAIAKVDEIIGE